MVSHQMYKRFEKWKCCWKSATTHFSLQRKHWCWSVEHQWKFRTEGVLCSCNTRLGQQGLLAGFPWNQFDALHEAKTPRSCCWVTVTSQELTWRRSAGPSHRVGIFSCCRRTPPTPCAPWTLTCSEGWRRSRASIEKAKNVSPLETLCPTTAWSKWKPSNKKQNGPPYLGIVY